MAVIICASGQRRFAELFVFTKIDKMDSKFVLKWGLSLSRQYVDDVRVS